MNFQVQPLKVLATREVVMNRMDYSTFLTGTTKDELDRLDVDNLAGTFKVQSSKLTIDAVYNGQRLPSENWQYFKECFNLPSLLIKIIENTEEINIFERGRPRIWVLSFSGHSMIKDLSKNRGELKQRDQAGLLGQDDDFIEDGRLVSVKKNYKMINGKMEFILNIRDSITLDKHGNLIWNYMWSIPYKNIKITKVVWAVPLGIWGQLFELGYLLLKYGYLLAVRGRR